MRTFWNGKYGGVWDPKTHQKHIWGLKMIPKCSHNVFETLKKKLFFDEKIFFKNFEFKKKSIFVKFVQNHQKLSIEPTLRGSRASGKCFRNF